MYSRSRCSATRARKRPCCGPCVADRSAGRLGTMRDALSSLSRAAFEAFYAYRAEFARLSRVSTLLAPRMRIDFCTTSAVVDAHMLVTYLARGTFVVARATESRAIVSRPCAKTFFRSCEYSIATSRCRKTEWLICGERAKRVGRVIFTRLPSNNSTDTSGGS